ncbi:MAG TPA: 4-hydroxy-2-oxo-heptane-1,7-dioate aldolase [Deltaproteobacteria bacterium]|nr:4-hydroxy-2-oxo-heptane-1,7-dioate aldolase [Deltaproteobacteria bacterium]
MRKNHLKEKLASGQAALGVWAVLGSEVTAGIAGPLGYDWILMDAEHGILDTEGAIALVPHAQHETCTRLIRVPGAGASDAGLFKRVLDMGFEGVLVPQIRCAREVEDVVSACRYPPRGQRGIASQRAHRYGLEFAEYLAEADWETLVLVQIETAEAVENIEEILAVEGLDGVFIGPADLSAALGVHGNPEAEVFTRSVAKILRAARAAGKPAGIYARSPEDATEKIHDGFRFVNIANDQSLLVRGLRAAREAIPDDLG